MKCEFLFLGGKDCLVGYMLTTTCYDNISNKNQPWLPGRPRERFQQILIFFTVG